MWACDLLAHSRFARRACLCGLLSFAAAACAGETGERRRDQAAGSNADAPTLTLFRCGEEPAPAPRAEHEQHSLAAIERAIDFLASTRESYALVMLDVIHRRFGVAAFADALSRYDAILATDSLRAPILRIFRRIADHDNVLQPGDEASVTTELNSLTVPALYCDRTPLPDEYADMLDQADRSGGYPRTHALLALQWLRDNDCVSPAPPSYEPGLVDAVAELIEVDGEVTDLELEAAAFLQLYGRGDVMDPAFVAETLAQQNDDGGWLEAANGDTDSDWHASVSALHTLLHAYCGRRAYPPMLAPGR